MPKYDVFISFSTADRKTVEGICGYLERYGYRCFVSYRDIPPAVSWPSFISSAIKDSSLMVAVFSKDFNVSNETERELTIASKNNIPILTFKVSDTVMSDSKEYFLANLNWIDAFPNPENYFGKLKESIEKLIGKPERGYLIDEEIRKQQEVEKEQKAREEREKLRRELEIERARRIEEEKRRRMSEQERVWLEHKLQADRQSTAKENDKKKMRKTPPPKPVPQWWVWVKRHILLIAILLLLVVLGIVLVKGGMLPIRKTVAPVDSIAQLTENGDTVPEALLHQLSSQEQSVVRTNELTQVQSTVQAGQVAQEKATVQTEPVGQPTVQAVSPVEQKKEEPVQQSSASVSVRQEKENLLFTVNGVEFKMVKVEGGTFWMGATEEQGDYGMFSEKPKHKVTLSGYYIGETEVTQELWKAVMGDNPSYVSFKGENCLPVEHVSWNDVREFIEKLNGVTGRQFRLPTEAEWEYAARGGKKSKGYRFSGSNNLDEVAWYGGNSGRKTHPVKGKEPNELGLYDMTGNVYEWCNDWFGDYSSGSQVNPKGSKKDSQRVVRGGNSVCEGWACAVCKRSGYAPTLRFDGYGFRLVMCP